MASNSAAWISEDMAYPLEIKSAEFPSPKENEVVIKSGAVAINPVDWAIQQFGKGLFSFLQYPLIVGNDVAGEVVKIGGSIKRFKLGDRVVGHAFPMGTKGAFQEYTVLDEHMTSPIPYNLSYEEAAVIPLGLSTAACGLFQKDHLALQYPSVDPKPTGETVLITGGASSVGSNAIQLAVAAGYEVITTASTKNFDYVKKLGASKVFDYNSETVIHDIIDAFEGKKSPGAFAIGTGSVELCFTVVERIKGVKFVSSASPLPEKKPETIGAKFVFGGTLRDNEVGKKIYDDFLPEALAKGKFVASPEPQVIGKGLSCLQDAFEVQKKGVSAKKIVVSL